MLKVLRRKEDFNPLYKTINVVTNRVESEEEGKEIYSKIRTVSSKFLNTTLDYLGPIYQDKNASMAIIEQKPIVLAYPNSIAARNVSMLASKLTTEQVEEYKKKEGIAKVFVEFLRSKRLVR